MLDMLRSGLQRALETDCYGYGGELPFGIYVVMPETLQVLSVQFGCGSSSV